MREDDYKLSMEKLYQQNRLLISALHEIYGEEIQSTSLFCLEHDISFLTRNKIMLVLNKYSMQHTMSEELFWKEKIYSEVKDFPNLDDCEFKKMLLLFWKHRLTRAHREKQLKMSCQALHNAPPNRT